MHSHEASLPVTRATLIRDALCALRPKPEPGIFDTIRCSPHSRTLAVELLQHPAGDPLKRGWLQALRAAGMPLHYEPDEVCVCGQSLALHSEANEREPIVVHVYSRDEARSGTLRKYRFQAQEAYPFALTVVLLVAHAGALSIRGR